MTDRVCRRIALAVLGAVLALVATLSPLTASASSGDASMGGDGHSTAARPHPAVAAGPAASPRGAAPGVHRMVGVTGSPVGAAATPVPLLTLLIGLLLAAGPPWRSRANLDRRRPRGPPAWAAAVV